MIVKAPNDYDVSLPSILLAGSIEMGKAVNWQDYAADRITTAWLSKGMKEDNFVILNPRRDDWDNSWEQTLDNPQFKRQVLWELEGLSLADKILFYFDPNTISPITLLELGRFGSSYRDGVVVCCSKDYFRRGNVEIFCKFIGTPLFETLNAGLDHLIKNL